MRAAVARPLRYLSVIRRRPPSPSPGCPRRSTVGVALGLCLASVAGPSLGLCVEVSIPTQVAGTGASLSVPVSFASSGEAVSGLQFDLIFSDAALNLSTVTGTAARSSGKTLYFGSHSPHQSRFLITGLNQNPISDGTIVNLFVNVRPGTALGTYYIHFDSALASDPAGNPVAVSTSDGSVTVQAVSGAAVALEGVLSAASLLPGPVAPGEIIAIMGSAIVPPADSGTANVTFDSLPAPLLYTSSGQINAVVPFGIAGRKGATLDIAGSSGSLARLSVPVESASPAIFTLDSSGTGQGAILNQDGTVNSPDNPAQRGSIVVLFATGAGQTDPPGTDGLIPTTVLPHPVLPVSVQIGGKSAEVLYAGAAPGLISGVLQVNCRVSTEIDSGKSVSVLLTVGGVTSPPVTLALR